MVAEKQLLEENGSITIDYTKTGWSEGFSIKPDKKADTNCGSCSC